MSNTNGTSTDIDPQKEERAGKVREVGSHAIWSLSSCKPSKKFSDIFFSLRKKDDSIYFVPFG